MRISHTRCDDEWCFILNEKSSQLRRKVKLRLRNFSKKFYAASAADEKGEVGDFEEKKQIQGKFTL